MKIFLDTEFTGLQKNTQLISIGLISETGKEFYAEFASVNTEQVEDWIKENVLTNTVKYGNVNIVDIVLNEEDYHFGTKEEIKKELSNWLNQFEDVELVSDVCHYDMVLFIDIFGTAFDIPKNVSPVCHDINQDISNLEYITDTEAFNRSREDILKNYHIDIKGAKHNSLYDAKVIKEIYEICIGE